MFIQEHVYGCLRLRPSYSDKRPKKLFCKQTRTTNLCYNEFDYNELCFNELGFNKLVFNKLGYNEHLAFMNKYFCP